MKKIEDLSVRTREILSKTYRFPICEGRPNINEILESLDDLSSVEYQKEVWLNEVEGLCTGQDNCFSDLFSGSVLGDYLASGEIVYSSEIDEKLRNLEDKYYDMGDLVATLQMLNSSEWMDIVQLAREIRELILKHENLD